MKINLNNKVFKSFTNTENGEVTKETVFYYKQKRDVVWAEYSGGKIIKGFFVGKELHDHIKFIYQHINDNLELMSGKCKSYPQILDDGKLRLNEIWEWTCNDFSSGKSTIVEI